MALRYGRFVRMLTDDLQRRGFEDASIDASLPRRYTEAGQSIRISAFS